MSDPSNPLPFREISADEAQLVAEEVRTIVGRDLAISSVQTVRDQRRHGVAVLRGRLLRPSHEVFPRWLAALNRRGYTPMLRPEPGGTADEVALHILAGVVPKRASNYWVNLLLFVLTVISTLFIGALYHFARNPPNSLGELFLPQNLLQGWPYAATLLGILTAHEFGHYFAARYHKVAVTLPYFLPLPLPMGVGGGTLGAFIQLREPIPDRRKLFDIGVAGPLAGFVIAVPLLFLGLSMTPVASLPLDTSNVLMEGNSLLYYFAKFLTFGKALPDWVTREDVMLDLAPITSAAWMGLLVTALNLLPVGQLDGGHTVFALFGEKAQLINRITIGILAVLAIAGLESVQQFLPILQTVGFSGWFVWLILIFSVLGPYHPPALDDVTELDSTRRWIGYLIILIFIITFIPVPLRPL